MSLNAFAIMLKPFLSKYLEPLEENGTIAKLQADIELVAKTNTIPELSRMVSELEKHNRLMERLFELIESGASRNDASRNTEPCPDTDAAGYVGIDRDRMLEHKLPD